MNDSLKGIIIHDNFKNYALILLTAITLTQTYFLLSEEKDLDCFKPETIDLVTNLPPLPISANQALQQYFVANRVVSLSVGLKSGHIGLVTIKGNYLNPCSVGSCKLEDTGIHHAHGYIAEHSAQDMSGYPCTKACNVSGTARYCYLSSGLGKYTCPNGPNFCGVTCQ